MWLNGDLAVLGCDGTAHDHSQIQFLQFWIGSIIFYLYLQIFECEKILFWEWADDPFPGSLWRGAMNWLKKEHFRWTRADMLDIVDYLSVFAILFVIQSMEIKLKILIENKLYGRREIKFLCMFCRGITDTILAVRFHFISYLYCSVKKLNSGMIYVKNS